MHSRKIILVLALLALAVGQVTLAHHSASHINHGFSQEITISQSAHDEHQHDKDGKDKKKHECPECLLTKSLQTAFYNTPTTFSFTPHSEAIRLQQYSFASVLDSYNSNTPRAPPVTLI